MKRKDWKPLRKECAAAVERVPLRVVLLILAILALWGSRHVLAAAFGPAAGPPSWEGGDLDTALLMGGLREAPGFQDTLRWWTGPWAGQVPFYRPLSSYVFWTEWKLFGDREALYLLPTVAAHLLATLLFGTFVLRLARAAAVPAPGLAAALAGIGFLGGFSSYRHTVVGLVLYWKNQPDTLAAACAFAALSSYLAAREAGLHRCGRATLWYLAACCFKEIALPLPAVFLAMECGLPGMAARPGSRTRLLMLSAAAASFFAMRWLALGGMGYTYGTNAEWEYRTLLHLLGPFGEAAVNGRWLGNAVALWTAAIGFLAVRRARPVRYAWIWLGGAALIGDSYLLSTGFFTWREALSPVGWLTGLYRVLNAADLAIAFATLTLIGAVVLLWPNHRAVTACFLLPLAFSSGPIHRYYLPHAGDWLVVGLAGSLALQRMLVLRSLPRQGTGRSCANPGVGDPAP
jgi:hypothetical protein